MNEKSPTTPPAEVNRDPITGEPGSHPLGTGIGAATGGAIGATIGALGGPVGLAAGAAIGAFAGGYVGHAAAEVAHPTDFDEFFWRSHHERVPYHRPDTEYDDYDPAYRYGTAANEVYRGQRWEDVEGELAEGWDRFKGDSVLTWTEARPAVRAAWTHQNRTWRAMEHAPAIP